ncbi:MAG: hypothetical protein R3F30_03300 [Planctomycetota bacterium]
MVDLDRLAMLEEPSLRLGATHVERTASRGTGLASSGPARTNEDPTGIDPTETGTVEHADS